MEDLLAGLALVLTPATLLWIVIGSVLGIVLGALPGLTATMGIALMLPVSLYLPTATGMAMLLAVYAGAVAGASIPAILLGIPGNPNAIATVEDGHAMSQRGEGARALGTAAVASLIGGLLGLVLLATLAPLLARATLAFGPAERFALGVLGLTLLATMAGRDLAKGLFAAAFGLALAMLGSDPISGMTRLPFAEVLAGTPLQGGLGLVPVLIGLFGLSQAFLDLGRLHEPVPRPLPLRYRDMFPEPRRLLRMWRITLESTGIGALVGAIPGAGASIAVFLARDRARRLVARHPDGGPPVGGGRIEGVYAPEVANNAVIGGAMIPLLTLAIPGDAATAVLLGALLVKGVVPGLDLFTRELALVYAILIGLGLALVAMFVFQLVGVRLFPLILRVPPRYLVPAIVILSLVGAFAVRGQATTAAIYDMGVALAFGVLGYLMRKGGYPLAPLILGFILGPMLEQNFRRAVRVARGDLLVFLQEPIAAGLLLVAAASLLLPPLLARRRRVR
jgi:putative tricarboxylic transport membrane protein